MSSEKNILGLKKKMAELRDTNLGFKAQLAWLAKKELELWACPKKIKEEKEVMSSKLQAVEEKKGTSSKVIQGRGADRCGEGYYNQGESYLQGHVDARLESERVVAMQSI